MCLLHGSAMGMLWPQWQWALFVSFKVSNGFNRIFIRGVSECKIQDKSCQLFLEFFVILNGMWLSTDHPRVRHCNRNPFMLCATKAPVYNTHSRARSGTSSTGAPESLLPCMRRCWGSYVCVLTQRHLILATRMYLCLGSQCYQWWHLGFSLFYICEDFLVDNKSLESMML